MATRKREPDPPVLLQDLARGVAEGELPRGVVLRGEERYFREKAIELLRTRAQALGHELCMHDGERGNPDFKLSALIDDLSGGGLFAAKRLVVVRNAGEHLKKAGTKDSPLTAAIRTFVSASEDAGTVVLSLATLRADHAVVKAIAKAGGPVLALRRLWDNPPPWNPDPRQAELVRWVLERARELGLGLTPDRAVYVCAATGNDLFALEDQLVRMKSLPDEGLDAVVWNAATAPWTVADHLVAGDRPRALAGVESLFHSGFQEKSGRRLLDGTALSAMLISSLSRSVRRSLVLAGELERGASEAEAAKAVGVSGRAVGDAIGRARARNATTWRGMLEEVSDLERRAKSSTGVDANDFALLAARWGG